jgi:hypothetical protein
VTDTARTAGSTLAHRATWWPNGATLGHAAIVAELAAGGRPERARCPRARTIARTFSSRSLAGALLAALLVPGASDRGKPKRAQGRQVAAPIDPAPNAIDTPTAATPAPVDPYASAPAAAASGAPVDPYAAVGASCRRRRADHAPHAGWPRHRRRAGPDRRAPDRRLAAVRSRGPGPGGRLRWSAPPARAAAGVVLLRAAGRHADAAGRPRRRAGGVRRGAGHARRPTPAPPRPRRRASGKVLAKRQGRSRCRTRHAARCRRCRGSTAARSTWCAATA